MITARDAAELLGVSRWTIYDYVKRGLVASQKEKIGSFEIMLVNQDHCLEAFEARRKQREKYNVTTRGERN